MTTHNVDINVTADTKQAEKSLSYLQSLMGEFGKQATTRLAGMLGAAAVAKMAFDKVSESISKNIATAKQVSQMAIKFNIDPKAMHSITMAANDAGVSVRSLTMAMKQLGQYAGKALTSKELQINFKQLGIDADKLNDIQAKPSKFLPEIAKALMEIGDENQRSAAGAALLGRQYQGIQTLIEELGSSEEARRKFLEHENAMTEDQIAANKEIAQIQNDLSDGFDKMVASVAPLLLWAMNFVNLLAQGLGYIKDIIFESEEAKAERESMESENVSLKINEYETKLKEQQEAGTLSDKDKEGIEKAGGVEQYVIQQTDALDKMEKARAAGEEFGKQRVFDVPFTKDWDKHTKQMELKREEAKKHAKGVTKEFAAALGITDDGSPYDRLEAEAELSTASASGALKTIVKEGTTKGRQTLMGKTAKAQETKMKKDMASYVKTKKTQAALIGQIYDPATDEMYNPKEYSRILEERGVGKEEAKIQIRAFEEEGARVKREKAEKRSGRQLAASERKLYDQSGNLKVGMDEAEQAEDALLDQVEARNEAYEDLAEQMKIVNGLEEELAEKKKDPAKNAADITRLELQISSEMLKKNELQVKFNAAVGQEVKAMEVLKRAKEKIYLEEQKREDKVKARIKAEEDFDKQMKYKLMKSEGRSAKDIDEERLKDEEAEYYKLLTEYKEEFNKAMSNEHKGDKGEPLSDAEKERLEGLTKGLDEQSRKVLESAFNLGNRESSGQVTSMRRIGGGGLEYGGVANTAKLQLDEAKKAVKQLEEIKGVLKNPRGVSVHSGEARQEGMVYGEVLPDIN